MRVLLIYSNQTRDLIPAPPIGLSYVATATRAAGHDVHFLDLLIAPDPQTALRDALRRLRPEAVGISVRNIDNVILQRLHSHFGELAGFIEIIRTESGRHAPIVLGGPAISVLGVRALHHLDADYAVRGEGEIAFPALLDALAAGRRPMGIPGVCWRDGDREIDHAPALLPSFGASGMQDWIDWRAYRRVGGTFAIQTKRGCPMPCNYCCYPGIEGREFRRRAPDDVADEIEAVHRTLAPRTFEFVDSTFNLPLDHALAICEAIVRRKLKVKLTTMGINPRKTSKELFALMKRAGFNSMMITPEAGNDDMLGNLDKGFSLEDVQRTARLARASGLHSTWFFMLGGPGETSVTVGETLAFVQRELRDPCFLSVFMTGIRMLPGTSLARQYADTDADLAGPVFYLSPAVSEAWMLQRVNETIRGQSNVVHAAEEGKSAYERTMHRALALLRVAPPYWRFLPRLLAFPLLHALRRNRPSIGTLPCQAQAGLSR